METLAIPEILNPLLGVVQNLPNYMEFAWQNGNPHAFQLITGLLLFMIVPRL